MRVQLFQRGNTVYTTDLCWANLSQVLFVWAMEFWAYLRYRLYVSLKLFLAELFIIYPLAGVIILLTGNTNVINDIRRHKDEDSDRNPKA